MPSNCEETPILGDNNSNDKVQETFEVPVVTTSRAVGNPVKRTRKRRKRRQVKAPNNKISNLHLDVPLKNCATTKIQSSKKSKKAKYMTEQMKTYYNNSWGGESFSVSGIQQTMPSKFS